VADTAAIRQGLVDALSNLDVGVVTKYAPVNPMPPCAYIKAGKVEYDLTMQRGIDKLTFVVTVLVATSADELAQEKLDALRAGDQVKAMIEADRTLGGACASLQVTEMTAPQVYPQGGSPTSLGCDWTVMVLASP